MGVMANSLRITQAAIAGADYTAVLITAHYESYLDIPRTLLLKNNDGLGCHTEVRRIRRWGDGGDTPSPPRLPFRRRWLAARRVP